MNINNRNTKKLFLVQVDLTTISSNW